MKVKKTLIQILMFISLIPICLSLAYFVDVNLSVDSNVNPNNSDLHDNFWNLSPNDEMVWILNDSLYKNPDLISQTLLSLQTRVADMSDSALDYDTEGDLYVDNSIIVGLDSVNLGIGINSPLDNLIPTIFPALFSILGVDNTINISDNVRMGENYSLAFPIKSLPFDTLSSTFWINMNRTMNYLKYIDSTYLVTYELYEDFINSPKAMNAFNIYNTYDTNTTNKIQLKTMPNERNYSQGLAFITDQPSYVELNNDSSHLLSSYSLEPENNNIFKNFWNGYFNVERAVIDFNIFPSSNQSLILSVSTNSLQDLKFTDYSNENESLFLRFENNSIYYLQSNYNSTFNMTATKRYFDEKPNFFANNWTYIMNMPSDQWNRFNLTIEKYRGVWGEKSLPTFTIGFNNQNLEYNLSIVDEDRIDGENVQFKPNFINFEVIKATGIGESYFDEWGVKGKLGDDPIPNPILQSSFTNPAFWLQYLEPSLFTIFPNHNVFNYTQLIKNMWDLILMEDSFPLARINSSQVPHFIETNKSLSIQFNETQLNYLISSINTMLDPNETPSLPLVYGNYRGNLTITINKENDLLESVIMKVDYLNLNMNRILSMFLTKTKTEGKIMNGYFYWDKTIYENNAHYLLKPEAYQSRLFGDSTKDKMNLDEFSLDFQILLDKSVDKIDPMLILNQILSKYPIESVFVISTFLLASIIPSALLWKKLNRKIQILT